MSISMPDGTTLDTKEGPCAICLEETITNPVVLPCGHAFCFSCVGNYKYSSNSKEASCPYCRGEIPIVGVRAMKRAGLYRNRAHSSSKGSEDRKKYAKLAIAELDSVIEIVPDKGTELNMIILYSKVTLISLIDQPEETVKIANKILLLNNKHPGILELEQVEETKCYQAEAYAALGKWKEAGKIYTALYNVNVQSGGHDSLVLMGLAQTKYELGKYDDAIEIGNVAIEEFRQCPGTHKYIALSYKAKGDIDEAKKTMSRAILYEKHWDKDNMQKNKQLLKDLNSL